MSENTWLMLQFLIDWEAHVTATYLNTSIYNYTVKMYVLINL